MINKLWIVTATSNKGRFVQSDAKSTVELAKQDSYEKQRKHYPDEYGWLERVHDVRLSRRSVEAEEERAQLLAAIWRAGEYARG